MEWRAGHRIGRYPLVAIGREWCRCHDVGILVDLLHFSMVSSRGKQGLGRVLMVDYRDGWSIYIDVDVS